VFVSERIRNAIQFRAGVVGAHAIAPGPAALWLLSVFLVFTRFVRLFATGWRQRM